MADTRPNIVVPARTVVDLYSELNAQVGFPAVPVGTQIAVQMIGTGNALLYAGASLVGRPDNSTGYEPIYQRETAINDSGDAGAFIWSDHGCTVNVEVV